MENIQHAEIKGYPTTKPKPKQGFKRWIPLLVMAMALGIIILDTTILNVSMRAIIGDFHTDIKSFQWVITTYSLILAAFTITGGRLGDLFGRKKMFITGAVLFGIGSFMTSIANSVGFMILGEAVIEGIGACLMLPATLSLLRSTYRGRDLQVAFGIWGGIAAGAATLGPVVGGYFTTYYSWRWAFRFNVIVAIFLVIAASVFIKEYRDEEEKPTIDLMGVALSALGMLSLVFGFIESSTYGWWKSKEIFSLFGRTLDLGGLSPTPVFVILGIIIVALFFRWEKRMERLNKTPLISTKLFKNKTFMTGSSVSSIISLGQAGLIFSVPIYLQSVLGLDPIETGIAMIPMSAATIVAAPLSAYLTKRIAPKRIIQAGIISDIIGFTLMYLSLRVGVDQWALAPGFLFFGIGMGFMMAQASNLTLSAVSVQESGEASGTTNTIRLLGQALGSAVMGAILISSLSSGLVSGVNQSRVIPDNMKPALSETVAKQSSNIEFGGDAALASAGSLPQTVRNEIISISHTATVESTRETLLCGIAFIILALLLSTNLPNDKKIKAESMAIHE